MRISDWSSDVCSSDLRLHGGVQFASPRADLPQNRMLDELDSGLSCDNHRLLADGDLPSAIRPANEWRSIRANVVDGDLLSTAVELVRRTGLPPVKDRLVNPLVV